jgi:hypothetical protein
VKLWKMGLLFSVSTDVGFFFIRNRILFLSVILGTFGNGNVYCSYY